MNQEMSWTVADVMTESVTTVQVDTPFKSVVEQIWIKGVSALPVVDEGEVVGIISEADCLLKEEHGLAERRQFWESAASRFGARGSMVDAAFLHDLDKAAGRTAQELMTVPVITVTPGARVGAAARLMHRHGIKRLVVVDQRGKLRGIVTRSDLLKVFLRSDEAIRDAVVDVLRERLPVGEVEVEATVTDGVVNLSGNVTTRDLFDIAEKSAGAVPGVVEVDNDLVYREPAAVAPIAGD
jgi:CBS-domain-containing membrane protein